MRIPLNLTRLGEELAVSVLAHSTLRISVLFSDPNNTKVKIPTRAFYHLVKMFLFYFIEINIPDKVKNPSCINTQSMPVNADPNSRGKL